MGSYIDSLLILFLALSVIYTFITVKGLRKKKPVFIPSQWVIFPLIACFFYTSLIPLNILLKEIGSNYWVWIYLAVLVTGSFYLLSISRGYMIFGITDEMLRDSLIDVLKKKNLAYQEILGNIKLISVPGELRVYFRRSMLNAHISITPYHHAALLKEIVEGMKRYYVEHNLTAPPQAFLGNACLALSMAVFLVFFLAGNHPMLKSSYTAAGEETKKYYYDNGSLKSTYNYKDGQLEGTAKEFSPDGTLSRQWSYLHGKYHGVSKRFYKTGQVQFEDNYVQGSWDQITKEYYKSGKLKTAWMHKDGLYHGITKKYYETGELMYEIPHVYGTRTGLTKRYYKDGKLYGEYPYDENGQMTGTVKEYYRTGELRFTIEFKDGERHGLTREMNKDGALKSQWTYSEGEIQE